VAVLGLAMPAAPASLDDLATALPKRQSTPALERGLVEGLVDLRQGQLEAAEGKLASLVEQQPDFKLAHLIRGDLWMARATGLTGFGHGLQEDDVEELLLEARARWSRYRLSPPPRSVPSGLLRVPESAPSALVIDLTQNRLFVFEGQEGKPRQTSDFYVSIGKNGSEKQREGDERTPVGFYLISEFLAGSTLPDLYGVGAFPINYPNGWDRLQGRTGSGIWIHGTESSTYSRPPRSSRGCVTLSNQDFQVLQQQVEIRDTPVLVADSLEWVEAKKANRLRRDLEASVEEWRQAWESRDADRYLDHYSRSFRTQGMGYARFASHKRQVNAGKKYIRVQVEDLGIYGYPGEPDMVVVDFTQLYESDSFSSSRRKHQYWRLEEGGWRIVFEERV
jgi:murein L,D-transpeptidase YafK